MCSSLMYTIVLQVNGWGWKNSSAVRLDAAAAIVFFFFFFTQVYYAY